MSQVSKGVGQRGKNGVSAAQKITRDLETRRLFVPEWDPTRLVEPLSLFIAIF